MPTRPILACLVIVGLLAGSSATASAAARKPAKPKTYCSLMVDVGKNDGQWAAAPVVSSKALDIVSGDIATGPTTMVAVLRLASTDMSPSSDRFANSGYDWDFSTTSSLGQIYAFYVLRSLTGKMTASVKVDDADVAASNFSFAIVGNTFVWVLKRAASASLARPKNVFGLIQAHSHVMSGSADTVDPTTATYPDKAPSCVAAK
jgi:hypothetical protein